MKPKLQPKYAAYEGTEDLFQITIARYLNMINALWFHPANERKTRIATDSKGRRFSPEGKKLSMKGVMKGVPDIIILNSRKGYNGMAIELKAKRNKPSPEQIEFLTKMKDAGWFVYVSNSLDEVIDLIDWYFN
jgi:hypothetical protein